MLQSQLFYFLFLRHGLQITTEVGMRKKSHISLAKYIVGRVEEQGLVKHKKAFYLGSILPDCKPSFFTEKQEVFPPYSINSFEGTGAEPRTPHTEISQSCTIRSPHKILSSVNISKPSLFPFSLGGLASGVAIILSFKESATAFEI